MLAWRIPKREELVGYCPQGYKELKRAERLSTHAMSTPGRKEKENRGESPLFSESIMKKRQNWSKKRVFKFNRSYWISIESFEKDGHNPHWWEYHRLMGKTHTESSWATYSSWRRISQTNGETHTESSRETQEPSGMKSGTSVQRRWRVFPCRVQVSGNSVETTSFTT